MLVAPRESDAADTAIGGAEGLIYIAAGALLFAAAILTLVGSIDDLIDGAKQRSITDTGVFILDRVLLLFIIAELLYTLRLVNFGGRILVEPFLFIGLIAVVRKILVITAEIQRGRDAITDFLIQIGALAGLALVLSLSIYLLRRGAVQQP